MLAAAIGLVDCSRALGETGVLRSAVLRCSLLGAECTPADMAYADGPGWDGSPDPELVTTILTLAATGDLDKLQTLQGGGTGINVMHQDGMAALPATRREIHNARPNPRRHGGQDIAPDWANGQTPLHVAVAAGQLHVIKWLVADDEEREVEGDDRRIARRDYSGQTALHYAARSDQQLRIAAFIVQAELAVGETVI